MGVLTQLLCASGPPQSQAPPFHSLAEIASWDLGPSTNSLRICRQRSLVLSHQEGLSLLFSSALFEVKPFHSSVDSWCFLLL